MSSRTPPLDNTDVLLPQCAGEPVLLRLDEGEPDRDPTEGSQRLAVFVGTADSYHQRQLPVAGHHERHGDFLIFTPAFGFVVGQDYLVRSQRNGESFRLTEFRIPRGATPAPTLVTAVYPSSNVLPENVLRFYVHFSVPMTPHLAFCFLTLRDASGAADRAAFMRFKQELWSADRTRLTVLIDPGRIKRSVANNLDLGPALLAGERYALTIDEGWPSADGSSILPPFSKDFRVVAALRERPDVERWSWQSPQAGTRDALVITFDRAFDRHRLRDAVHVIAGDGQTIDGTPLVGENETSWSFTPDEPWTASDIRVTVDDALEDIAGNKLHELLDRHIGQR